MTARQTIKKRAETAGAGALNLVKLCVGAESVADLEVWQTARAPELARAFGDPRPRHRTRMQPKRGDELLEGGSLYWVIKGVILCRQKLVGIEPIECEDGLMRYDLVLDPEIVATRAQPRRPFQGWRYLTAADAPGDAATARGVAAQDALPPALASALADVGVV